MDYINIFHNNGQNTHKLIYTIIKEIKQYLPDIDEYISQHLTKENYNDSIIKYKNFTSEINQYIDHTLLRADATKNDIDKLYEELKEYNFNCVCINSSRAGYYSDKTCVVVGFPLGATNIETKCYEIDDLWGLNGIKEVDFVINIGRIKDRDINYLIREINEISKKCKEHQFVSKAILETSILTKEEIIIASLICYYYNIDFIKTSTGFSTKGAEIDKVILMLYLYHGKDVKVSGGIKDYDTAKTYLSIGVTRIGTSTGVNIIKQSIE